MGHPRLPEYVVTFLGQQHLPFREAQAEYAAHQERQGVSTVVDTPIRAHLAAFIDRPLHLDVTRGTGIVRSRQEMAHQPAAPVGSIVGGVAAGYSRGSQHSLSFMSTVTPLLSFTSSRLV